MEDLEYAITRSSKIHAELEAHLVEYNERASSAHGDDFQLSIRTSAGLLVAGASGTTWGETAWLHTLWVQENQRRKGLGAHLLEGFEALARSRRCRKILLSSYTFQSPAFYASHGYSPVARIADVPAFGSELIHFWKQLEWNASS